MFIYYEGYKYVCRELLNIDVIVINIGIIIIFNVGYFLLCLDVGVI